MKKKCQYNISRNSPDFLPVINCRKKAKWLVEFSYVLIDDNSYGKIGALFHQNFCKKHLKKILDCMNLRRYKKIKGEKWHE